jgi:hypothetical protein
MNHKRIRGGEYQDCMGEYVAAAQRVYPEVLLRWEEVLESLQATIRTAMGLSFCLPMRCEGYDR